jgi:hypothetical protein
VKKFFVFAIALLVLGFAVNSFAIQAEIPADTTAAIAKGGTQVTIGGEIRMRAFSRQNTNDFDRNRASSSSGATTGTGEAMAYDFRTRLSVEAKMSPNTIGFIQMEAGGDSLPNSFGVGAYGNTGENTAWGSEGCKTLGGTFKCGDVKANEFRVLQAWIQHSGSGLFGVPAYVKVGHQPITIGAGIFYRHDLYNDDAAVVGITPIKGLDITAVTVKLAEGNQNSSDDQTLYSGIISYAINKDIKIGLDVSLLQSQNGSALAGYATTTNASPTPIYATPINPYAKADLWNIGANIKANVAGFALYATGDIQAGQANYGSQYGTAPYGQQYAGVVAGNRYPFRGYAVTAGAKYTFAPVTLGLDLGYGSGDRKSDQKIGTFQTAQADQAKFSYWVYDYFTINSAGNRDGGLQNLLQISANARADVMKDLMLGANISFLRAARKAYGGGSMNEMYYETASSNIGTEVDLYLNYQIDKGLRFYVDAGYLFAGNYWKGVKGYGNATTANPLPSKISDPWAIRPGFILNF